MPYIIDGHNLIPNIPGIELDDLDDEIELIKLIQKFCVENNKKAELYFDRASTGHSRAKVHGRVTARFVHERETADVAISRHLKRLGAEAKNWVVVSSDAEVTAYARGARAKVLSSSEFAALILNSGKGKSVEREDVKLNEAEVDEWMKLFGND
jgi:predicted RNA-binding protein with PIN domain